MNLTVIPRNHGKAYLEVDCKTSKEGKCRWSLWREPAQGIMWNWNGNMDAPTITPSINCLNGCGRHFTITQGKANF